MMLPVLLPEPKKMTRLSGMCPAGPQSPLQLHLDDPRVERAILRWRNSIYGPSTSTGTSSRRTTSKPPDRKSPPPIRVSVDHERASGAEGYRLDVTTNGIEIVGGSAVGCFHGVQTLIQLYQHGSGDLVCLHIEDRPDFATRGLLHDVTRGKVPRLETLKLLADRLAGWKINQLQLYIEHAFVFSFDADICDADHGLTPDEIRELDAYCRERFIDLVPALATPGHMGRILSMPRYRHLAEIETFQTWAEMSWPQRARGLTLDCANPESCRLVERMWSDVLDAFSSPVVNLCGDEPWDLGKGKNRDRFVRTGCGPPYVEQIRKTYAVCAARERRCQVWSDVVRNHPHLLSRWPRDLTILHWGYDDEANYEGVGAFVEAGFPTFVCPGTSGWKRILPAIDLAERNISTFAAAGKKVGAAGLLNTDWGDHGHFHPLACSWHGIALGAAKAWSADHPEGAAFDIAFAQSQWECGGDPGHDRSRSGIGENLEGPRGLKSAARWRRAVKSDDLEGARAGIELMRKASHIAERVETWRWFQLPLEAMGEKRADVEPAAIADTENYAERLCAWCLARLDHADPDSPAAHDLAELEVAARFQRLFAQKWQWFVNRDAKGSQSTDVRAWVEEVAAALTSYADIWHTRYKPAGFSDINRALLRMLDSVKRGLYA